MSLREIKAPHSLDSEPRQLRLFLAGSIEMDTAERWQDRFIKLLDPELPLTVLNPRRDHWDSTWEQRASNPKFSEQVNWELDGLTVADLVLFYFDPNTKAPITLLEFGLQVARMDCWPRLLVVCPDGYWRKGNVDIVCSRNLIRQVDTLEQAARIVKHRVDHMTEMDRL